MPPDNPQPPELLDAEQLADRLGLRPDTIRRWGRTGHIPRLELSPKVVRYDWCAVVAAMREGVRHG